MKKIILSAFVVLGLVGYVAYQATGGTSSASTATASTVNAQPTPTLADTTSAGSSSPGVADQRLSDQTAGPETSGGTQPVTTVAPVPATKPQERYVDGTYTGSAADAYYGTVQVSAVVKNGKLSKVSLLQYPNDRDESQQISNRSLPVLESEAIQSQSAQVNGVSGATQTSEAFTQSLASALAKAKNS